MNNKNIIGIALVAIAAGMVCLITSSAGESAAYLFGKAVWTLPYISLVGAVRFFKA